MKLHDLQEAKYHSNNAAQWVQQAVDKEFDLYDRKKSWPVVAQTLGHQTYKFDYTQALADLTAEYGEPTKPYDEDDVFWQVPPSIAYSKTDHDDCDTLDVGLDKDGLVSIWDVTDE